MKTPGRVRVLIVDDSASVRQVLREVLESDPQIEVIGVAQDPYVAVERIKQEIPDVMTLDIEMPRMDGLTFLDRIMSQHPIPVVVCSTLTGHGSDTALAALEKGAVDIIAKPKLGAKEFMEESRVRICDVVKSAARARLQRPRVSIDSVKPKLTADAVIAAPASRALIQTTETVVVVGASTGGTEALREFLEALPLDAPGVVIVQHMPEAFTARFAQRLDHSCRVAVKEAAENDSVLRGQVLIAPGNRHLLLKRSGARYFVELRDGPLVSRHRPSVDVLFRSAARYGGRNVIGVIMTGMGDDGARGMLEMKQAGSFNIAQNEATSVVFGMPAEAIKAGGVDRVLPLGEIAREVVRLCHAQ
ncbi:protein-glutamate methylesterase/protein-glutamine glutaminase [Paludibaculum fermentans]|uniref:Protein-glutamate methylesterase/protein-glutamine glutaminase n=1 Tax=Paludibaculum fermentans TaxID=1473598 RepID=A0A7S7SIR4_PALFE|nr:chemotaxis response regulator protein-glutamate methylesterase [Paludibaculum fermentans]QOY85195.1 chemotaxis response regulator protein-glutamate methylesterase [Paludibaculum fermentans]